MDLCRKAKLNIHFAGSAIRCSGRVTILAALLLLLIFSFRCLCADCFAYERPSEVYTEAYTEKTGSTLPQDRLVRVFLYRKACWKRSEELIDYTDVLGDGDTYQDHLGSSDGFNVALCDQYRVSVRSLIDGSLETGETAVDYADVELTSSDEDLLEIGSDGKITLHETGSVIVTASVKGDNSNKKCTVKVPFRIAREYGYLSNMWSNGSGDSITVSTSDGPQQLIVHTLPGAEVTYSSRDPFIADVDENGLVTPISPGTARIYSDIDAGDHGQYEPHRAYNEIIVTGPDTRSEQTISGNMEDITVGCGETADLQLTAMTELSYRSDRTGHVTVDSSGTVKGIKAGTAVITVSAAQSKEYKTASAAVTIHVRDYEAEEAARLEQERKEKEQQAAALLKQEREKQAAALKEQEREKQEAARLEQEKTETARKESEKKQAGSQKQTMKKAIRQARNLKAPKLKCKAKKKKAKLTWNKVTGASGYQLYIRYPGEKKYVKALTKNATIKSVTHRGISSNMKYSYKLRAFAVVNGKYYYGPFSKAKTVRIR